MDGEPTERKVCGRVDVVGGGKVEVVFPVFSSVECALERRSGDDGRECCGLGYQRQEQ